MLHKINNRMAGLLRKDGVLVRVRANHTGSLPNLTRDQRIHGFEWVWITHAKIKVKPGVCEKCETPYDTNDIPDFRNICPSCRFNEKVRR